MAFFEKYCASCPWCSNKIIGTKKIRVPGTFNQYKTYCRICSNEIKFCFKKGLLKEVVFNFFIVFILAIFFFFVEKYAKYNEALYFFALVISFLFILFNFLKSISMFVKVKKIMPVKTEQNSK